ncbi:MAG: putative Ig domain-containing protein, partial [Planctomycetia bacterium]
MKNPLELALANVAKRLALLALAGSAALLAACGGGGTSDSGKGSSPVVIEVPGTDTPVAGGQDGGAPVAAPLYVATLSLPAAQAGAAYEARLQAANAVGAVSWSLVAGQLPAGLALGQDGLVAGEPAFAGVRSFTVRAVAADGQAASRSLAIAVDAFGLLAVQGLEDGRALTDHAIALSAVGAVGEVRFKVVENGSGGLLGLVAGHEATWRTGTVGGAVDAVRALDLATGASAEIRFEVRRDLAAGFVAEFGSSDVWVIDTAGKSGAHAFATDFQARE